ncbi:NAD-dependent epimerase/dehydratase family protein [Rhizobium sp. CC-YZS058]|uniref:NAD-dependent epimerase/dehydratase family protein n=1 Tax=Rhizobium sp. CC-YZS058 TaxID=3042153 RepID=UPI002B059F56|nr:NAD-dependent epimerase/dehydratase family protein [Rhizobium sp. CC-YZS058]MEA3535439.1 NAD-dependent epimerase/dehydratase family protein [Rhizobium sp. CC-YZS058]
MHYLVTGSAGFIGYHLSRRLLQEGHHVVGFDGLTPYYDVELKRRRHQDLSQFAAFTPVIGRLEDRDALLRAVAGSAPDVILHLAAQAGVRYSLQDPESYVSSNLIGTFNILELARQVRPGHLLMASTSSIYGANTKVPFSEGDKADEPLTIYAATKKSSELMAHSHAHLYRVPTTAFRFFTVYGPWGRPDMALFRFVEAIRKGMPIDVYGEGKMTRDFTYIDDIVEGILRLAALPPNTAVSSPSTEQDSLSPQAPFRVVNIGGGRPVELFRFIDIIETCLGRRAVRHLLPMQQGDVPHTFASPDLMQALTGFRPQIDIEEGVRRFVAWHLATYQDGF